MIDNEVLDNIFNIPVIKSDRRYWLIRTDGGQYWEQFKEDNFVSIGWNDYCNMDEYKEKISSPENESILKEDIRSKYETEQPGKILNTIKRFMFDLNIGDIVMIPSANSLIISFGEIVSDCYCYELTDSDIDNEKCDHLKRRNVRWIKDVYRSNIDPLLFKIFYAHQTISNADDYDYVIDRTLHNIYVKNNITHLKVNVKTKDQIKGKTLYNFQKLVYDSELDTSDDLEMKINVQSPGFIEFISLHRWDIVIISFAITVIVGGGKFLGFELAGIIDAINKISKNNREKDQHEFEKQKEIFNILKEQYGDDLKKLDIETDNIFLTALMDVNQALNPEISVDNVEPDNN